MLFVVVSFACKIFMNFLVIGYSFLTAYHLDPDIRYCVLSSLDEQFDAHLAQPENLQALFVALNDEEFDIRERALCTIGRLGSLNPAYIMPSLRKTLLQV